MKTTIHFLLLLLICSCGNKLEEIKYPGTGLLKLSYEYYLDDSGQKIKDGRLTKWNPDGTKKLEQQYSDGEIDGLEIIYKSGDYVEKYNYKKGMLNGENKVFIENVLRFKQNYQDDKLSGNQIWYAANGKKSALGLTDKRGVASEWKSFNDKGVQTAHFHFNSSGGAIELTGTWREQNTGGNEYFYKFFEDGTFEYWSPLFKYSPKGFKTRAGEYTFSDQLALQSFREENSFDVVSADKQTLVLRTENREKVYRKQ